jgi:subtilisin
MQRQYIHLLTTSALGFIAISIIMLGAWNIFPGAKSQTLAPQNQVSTAELSAATEAQRQVAAKLTRSASFDQRFQKLSDKARKNGIVPVIVKVRAAFSPEGYITSAAEQLAQRKVIKEAQDRLLAGLRYEPASLKRYDDVPHVAVSVDSYGLEQLQLSADVLDVVGDIPMKLATGESLPQIKAGRAWRAGYSGAGKTVVILDSGVDKTHPALSNKVVAEACFSTGTLPGYESLCPGNAPSSTAVDSGKNCDKAELSGVGGCGHGTHIAGIAAGRSGVAKDANVISIQVMSYVTGGECGFGTCLRSQTSDVMDALDHVYNTLRNSHSIAAVNISLVTDITGVYEDPCDAGDGAPLKAKIDQLRSVGIPTVIAAGNDGFSNALGYPACISTSVSVGAVGDGSGEAGADAVWQDSNSADYLKLLAPGDGITSAIPGGGDIASGTSQAAAHVTGAWAILKQMAPAMSVDDALNRLYTTGKPISDARNGLPFRRIQVDGALGVNVPEDMWQALYFNNRNLDGIPAVSRNEGDGFIDRYFNAGESPVAGVGAENYSVRWIRTPTFTQEGTYRFSVTGDDGVRLYIDGQSMIPNGWRDQSPTTYNANVHLDVGNHEIRLEYYQAGGLAQVRLNWGIVSPLCSQDVPTVRWRGEYYNNAYLGGSPVAVKDDGGGDSLNFNWGGDPPNTGCNLTAFPDHFSVRWTRSVNFAQGTYRFRVTGDNGVRLKVGGHVWIERWTETMGTNTAEVPLSADNHTIELEFFEATGGASVSLSWEPVCQVSVVTVYPGAYQTPDPGRGGNAVTSPSNTGHGETNAYILSETGTTLVKSCRWSAFQPVSGQITRITLKFDWLANGYVRTYTDSNPGDSASASASFGILYSTDNGSSFTTAIIRAESSLIYLSSEYKPFSDSGSFSVDLPAGTPINQILVSDALSLSASETGEGNAEASVNATVWNIRLEVERRMPIPCVP